MHEVTQTADPSLSREIRENMRDEGNERVTENPLADS